MSKLFKKESVRPKAIENTVPAETLLDTLPYAVMVVDRTAKIIDMNAAALDAFPGAGILSDVVAIDHPLYTAAQSVFTKGSAVTVHDIRLGSRSGEAYIAPINDKFFVVTLHLPSPLARADWVEKVRGALKPAQLITRTLAHEIRNPLSGIRAAAQLLARSKLSADDLELVVLISAEIERINRLVDKVNVFEDLTPESFTPVNIHAALADAVRVVRTAFDIAIDERYDPSLPDIAGSFDHLVRVFLNVVKNAAEAGGDRIAIRTSYAPVPPFHPRLHHKMPICVEIEDNGIGIDDETMRHIFEPWYTTKPAGEGLGLAVVSKTVDDHGGMIEAESQSGRTVFRLHFPMEKRS